MGMTSVRMPDELLRKLEIEAEKRQRSKGWMINEAVKEYLSRVEAREKMREETLAALEDVKAGRLIEGEKVMQWLESWGRDDELPPPEL